MPPPLDLAALQAEAGWQSLDLVKADALMAVRRKDQFCCPQLGAVDPDLQIKAGGIAALAQQLAGQSGFSALAGPHKPGCSCLRQGRRESDSRSLWEIVMHWSFTVSQSLIQAPAGACRLRPPRLLPVPDRCTSSSPLRGPVGCRAAGVRPRDRDPSGPASRPGRGVAPPRPWPCP